MIPSQTIVAGEHIEETRDGVSLIAARCRRCAAMVFPAQLSCPRCTASDMTAESLPSHGTLWSYTIQRFAPKAPFDGAGQTEFRPYGVGYVAFADSVIVEGRLTEHEPERLRIGQSMKVVVAPYTTTDDGSELVTYAFAPNE